MAVKAYIKNPKRGAEGQPKYLAVPFRSEPLSPTKARVTALEKIEYNVSQANSAIYVSLAEAIAAVTDDKYKVNGIVLTFNTGTEWISKRYIGADSTGFSNELNWVDVGGGSGEHTLDLSPLFDEGGSPVSTVTDEFLAEVKKAYEERYSNAVLFGGNAPMMLQFQENLYVIDIMFLMNDNKRVSLAAYHIVINSIDKSSSLLPIQALFDQSGTGTKALTDNGQYAEFAPEAPKDNKSYARSNGTWIPLDGLGGESHYLIDLDLTGSITSLTDDPSVTIPIYGKTYEKLTNDNIYEQLGGLEGLKKLHADLKVLSKNNYAVVCPYQYFYYPGYLVFTGVASVAITGGSNFSEDIIQGGQYLLYLRSELGALMISIDKIGEVDQSASITFQEVNYITPSDVRDSFGFDDSDKPLSARLGVQLNNEKVSSDEIDTIKKLTQSEYDRLSSKNSKTMYVIVG